MREITREVVILLLDQITCCDCDRFVFSLLIQWIGCARCHPWFFPALDFHVVNLVCYCFVPVIIPLIFEYLFHPITSAISLL